MGKPLHVNERLSSLLDQLPEESWPTEARMEEQRQRLERINRALEEKHEEQRKRRNVFMNTPEYHEVGWRPLCVAI